MHSNIFDRYQISNSTLHRLSPIVKVVVAILFIFSNALLPDGDWRSFGISWAIIFSLNLLARLGWGYTLKRSLIALAAITALFSLPGKTLAIWHLGSLELILTDAGLLRFLSILVRSWLSVQIAILLVATTQFPDLIHALEHLRLPKMLVTIIAFLYRYMSVLTDEVLRLLRARQSRSALLPEQRGGGNLLWRARTAGNMVGQLFLRSYERSDRIYHAMLSRGYRGHLRTLNPHSMSSRDWTLIIFAFLLIVLLQFFAHII
jgi:cobalt/nickel transport system permease protein